MKQGLAVVLVVVGFGIWLTRCRGSDDQEANGHRLERGVVEKLVDGDTLWIRLGNVTEKTRLVLIDTPETVDPSRPDECFGEEASSAIARILPVGTKVLVERARQERDRYGRLLAFVYRARDRVLVNERLVERGFATVLAISPNTNRLEEFADAELTAREANRGLWAACRPQRLTA